MDENGKINGLVPIFNDILGYVYNKVKYSNTQPLADVVSTFYQMEELKRAWEILYPMIDPSGDRQLARMRKRTDIA